MWWESLTSLQQTSFVIATIATLLMIIFIIMMLMGMDGAESFDGDVDFDMDMDVDADFDTDIDFDDVDAPVDVYNNDSIVSISGLKVVTIRGGLAFFSIGGWVLFILLENNQVWLSLLLSFVAGSIAAVLLAYAMRAVMKLESSGNLNYMTAVGKTAEVYIRIPKNSSGKGKIMFNHQGRMIEVDAITKENNDITSKNEVRIVGLDNETTLVVKKIIKEN